MVDAVIDVSHYQAGLDLAAFQAAGGLAVIAKASQGTSVMDASYTTFRRGAYAAGLAFAAYHYLSTEDAAKQAAFFLKCADPLTGSRVICDWEEDGVTAVDVVAFLKAIALIRPDLQLTVYSGSSAKAGIDAVSSAWLAKNTSLWLAQYTTGTPSWPKQTWPDWSLWQYTELGGVPGYSGAVDGSRFNGPTERLLAWFGPTSTLAASTSPSASQSQTSEPVIDIQISASAPVTIKINGVAISLPALSTA